MDNNKRIVSTQDLLQLIHNEYHDTVAAKIGSIDQQIYAIDAEIASIHTELLPWDVVDYAVVFLAGIMGGLADLTIGKPGGYKEPKIEDNSFWGLGKWLKQYDIKDNPIDKQIPGAFGGDHRIYSYGHDLFRFFSAIRLIMTGHGPVGISVADGSTIFESIPSGYPGYDPFQAVVILILHLIKDFWTARSLPIPGTTWIAELNNNQIPAIVIDLYSNKEVNLRQLSGQAFSLTIIELTIRIACFLKYRHSDAPKDLVTHKRDMMRLTSHSIAMLFNLGKVIIDKNPFLLNIPQFLQIVLLGFRALKDASDLRNKVIVKINLSTQRTYYQMLRTMILLDKAIVVTTNANEFYKYEMHMFKDLFLKNEISTTETFAHIESQIEELGKLNKTMIQGGD